MRKGRIAVVVFAVFVVLAVILGGTYLYVQRDRETKAVQAAESAQREAYGQYTALRKQVEDTTLTVTEQGREIGVYDLAQLGLLDLAMAQVEAGFGALDRMPPEAFSALTAEEKLTWESQAVRQAPAVTLDGAAMDCGTVLLDLAKVIRSAPKNAYAYFENGAYAIAPEVPGTQLDSAVVEQALRQAVDGAAPTSMTFEITECQPYVAAAVTAATGVFDYAALLPGDAAGAAITVELLDQTETLEVAPLVTVDDAGVVQADRAALTQIVAGWAEIHRGERVPYVLDSYAEGPIQLDFIAVNYELDQTALVAMLERLVPQLESLTVEAPFFCTRGDAPFAIDGTYVEVDIDNQQMTYYENGEPVVHTDIVSGYPWGHWTPPGLYAVQNKDTDCWLSGEDYNVFVEYWVGFHGAYGIHDASWRTIFGGKKYLTDGSHGCVNTPTEAMKTIHERIEVGVPVVVHDEKDPDD